VTLRSDIWAAALDIYTRAPIVGAGLNNFGTAYGRLPSTPNNATQKRLLHGYNVIVPPHAQNQYLNILAEQGIIGIFGFLLLFGGAIRLAFRTGKMPDAAARAIGMGVGAGLVALAIQSLLDAFFIGEIAFPFYGLAAVLGVLCALRQPAEAVEEGPGVSRPAWPALAS
jgi:O-antigen ligase